MARGSEPETACIATESTVIPSKARAAARGLPREARAPATFGTPLRQSGYSKRKNDERRRNPSASLGAHGSLVAQIVREVSLCITKLRAGQSGPFFGDCSRDGALSSRGLFSRIRRGFKSVRALAIRRALARRFGSECRVQCAGPPVTSVIRLRSPGRLLAYRGGRAERRAGQLRWSSALLRRHYVRLERPGAPNIVARATGPSADTRTPGRRS